MIALIQILIVLVIIGLILLLPLMAIIDIVRNEFSGNNKLVWVLVVLLFPIIGSIIYFIIGGEQKTKKN